MKWIFMAYLYFNMISEVTIGNIVINTPIKLSVTSSIKKLSDTAKLTFPRNFNFVDNNKRTSTADKNITKFIKVGDKVSVKLGYDDNLKQEFTGYVAKISADTPLVIDCEDEMWKLKQTSFTKSYKNISLEGLLNDLLPNYPIKAININLGKFIIKESSTFEVLQALRKDYLLHAYFKNGTLKVGFPTDIVTDSSVNVDLKQTKSISDLKYVKKDDIKLQIKAISNFRTGSKIIVEVGESGGAVRTLNFYEKSKSELEKLANDAYKNLSFDGFQGNLLLYGQPAITAGDTINIIDTVYSDSDRSGKYIVEEVVKEYSQSGYTQKVKLGMKL